MSKKIVSVSGAMVAGIENSQAVLMSRSEAMGLANDQVGPVRDRLFTLFGMALVESAASHEATVAIKSLWANVERELTPFDYCECSDCQESPRPCGYDCDRGELECEGCRERRLEREEIEHDIDVAQGRR